MNPARNLHLDRKRRADPHGDDGEPSTVRSCSLRDQRGRSWRLYWGPGLRLVRVDARPAPAKGRLRLGSSFDGDWQALLAPLTFCSWLRLVPAAFWPDPAEVLHQLLARMSEATPNAAGWRALPFDDGAGDVEHDPVGEVGPVSPPWQGGLIWNPSFGLLVVDLGGDDPGADDDHPWTEHTGHPM